MSLQCGVLRGGRVQWAPAGIRGWRAAAGRIQPLRRGPHPGAGGCAAGRFPCAPSTLRCAPSALPCAPSARPCASWTLRCASWALPWASSTLPCASSALPCAASADRCASSALPMRVIGTSLRAIGGSMRVIDTSTRGIGACLRGRRNPLPGMGPRLPHKKNRDSEPRSWMHGHLHKSALPRAGRFDHQRPGVDLPSPLAGEGPGERGRRRHCARTLPPSPQPLPREGGGACSSTCRGPRLRTGSGSGAIRGPGVRPSAARTPAAARRFRPGSG